MSTEKYNPLAHLDAKKMWDESIAERACKSIVFPEDTTWHADKFLHACRSVAGQWAIQKWLTQQEYSDAYQEIKSLCYEAGLDPLCIHCSSRATVHITL